jgi:hypothetical protein
LTGDFFIFPLDQSGTKVAVLEVRMKEKGRAKTLREEAMTSSFFYINSVIRTWREKLRITGPVSESSSPSFYYFEDDERTQKFINASFLPFFALLSIPPSFN